MQHCRLTWHETTEPTQQSNQLALPAPGPEPYGKEGFRPPNNDRQVSSSAPMGNSQGLRPPKATVTNTAVAAINMATSPLEISGASEWAPTSIVNSYPVEEINQEMDDDDALSLN